MQYRNQQKYQIDHTWYKSYLYVNLSIQNILRITKFWLNKCNNDSIITEQILNLLETILKQKYFQYNNQYNQHSNGIAMGSPISSTLAEIYLQYF
jgi:hypothetical protein